ncbi:hypothetical protein GCM10023205_65570 [Yinghuangia aomiensis]|uniref:Amine oxidase domain-containing protein n=1 Tax=Yinghuangia aomiensis TaxID=676205 RepID=A0ABP9I3F1_9ACTN
MTEVAVVGAGFGGCYAAYRLAAAGRRVAVYERTYRIGGRIRSAPLRAGGWAELGAMRLNTEAAAVMALVEHLGLAAALEPFPFGRPETFAHTHGGLRRRRDLAAMPDSDADMLVARAVEAAVPGFARMRAAFHAARGGGREAAAVHEHAAYRAAVHTAAVHGVPLRRVSWPRLLDAALTPDAVRRITHTGGYDVHTGGAAEWIDVLFDTPPDAHYVALSCGMQALPTILATRCAGAGGRTRLGHRLVRLETTGKRYELTFAVEDFAGRDTGGRECATADAVVLALPQAALQAIEFAPHLAARLRPQWRADLAAVQPVRALKLFLAYPEPWWQACGVTEGRSTTELPLRQVWYAPGGASHLLLAAYPSGPSTAMWDRFAADPERYPVDPADGTGFADAPPAPAAAVAHAHRLLCRMHGVDAPPPVAACLQDWAGPRHAAAWHVWRTGRSPGQVAPRMRAPVPGEAVYVVSDCWTGDPGSIPGVLGCAEDVLRDHLGLPEPPWLG